jgi:uncharacterized protein (DUF433 family)
MTETQSPPADTRIAALEARLARIESALRNLPGLLDPANVTNGSCSEWETPAEPWKHLVVRRHPWRKQLYLKGRNMTVRVLVGTIKSNGFTEEQAASDQHLPVEAIREALAYFEANPEVIELDAAYERYLRKTRGLGRGPTPVPG